MVYSSRSRKGLESNFTFFKFIASCASHYQSRSNIPMCAFDKSGRTSIGTPILLQVNKYPTRAPFELLF